LFNLFDFEAGIFAKVSLDDEGYKDSPLRMCMDTAAGTTLESCEKEGCASRRFEGLVWI